MPDPGNIRHAVLIGARDQAADFGTADIQGGDGAGAGFHAGHDPVNSAFHTFKTGFKRGQGLHFLIEQTGGL